jgi:hypothetical protein
VNPGKIGFFFRRGFSSLKRALALPSSGGAAFQYAIPFYILTPLFPLITGSRPLHHTKPMMKRARIINDDSGVPRTMRDAKPLVEMYSLTGLGTASSHRGENSSLALRAFPKTAKHSEHVVKQG